MTDEEIVGRIRQIKDMPLTERCARRSISLNGISAVTGVGRATLYRIARGEQTIGNAVRPKLIAALECEWGRAQISGPKAGVRPVP